MPKKVNDQNFKEEVLESDQLVLVDFWAPWCGPCKMLGPILEKLDEEYKDKDFKVAKLNVDENKKTASEYGVNGIPTMFLFKDGETIHKMVGVKPLDALKQEVDNHLEN